MPWASHQLRKIAGCACAGNAGNVFPPPRVSDPDMHHGTCMTHVPGCMPGSLTRGFHRSRWWRKQSRHSRCMCNPHFYVSDKKPMAADVLAMQGDQRPTYWISTMRVKIASWLVPLTPWCVIIRFLVFMCPVRGAFLNIKIFGWSRLGAS